MLGRTAKVKVKASHTRYRALGPEQQSRQVKKNATPPGLQLPPQPQGITALWPVPSYTALWQRHIDVNNLPKVVTQRSLEQDLNPWPTDRKPKCLTRCTTAPPKCYSTIKKLHCTHCITNVPGCNCQIGSDKWKFCPKMKNLAFLQNLTFSHC